MHFIFDIDKTYLNTKFEDFFSLIKIPFESAREKVNVPASGTALKALSDEGHIIQFVTASPPQMASVLEEKMRLDGIKVDHVLYKNQMSNLLNIRPRAIKDQITYKLIALLKLMQLNKANQMPLILVGDDYETDCFTFALYADFIDKKISLDHIISVLLKKGAYLKFIDSFKREVESTRSNLKPVDYIFINRARANKDEIINQMSPKIYLINNYLEFSIYLWHLGHLSGASVIEVFKRLRDHYKFSEDQLISSINQCCRRHPEIEPIKEKLKDSIEVGSAQDFTDKIEMKRRDLNDIEEHRDYLNLLDLFTIADKNDKGL